MVFQIQRFWASHHRWCRSACPILNPRSFCLTFIGVADTIQFTAYVTWPDEYLRICQNRNLLPNWYFASSRLGVLLSLGGRTVGYQTPRKVEWLQKFEESQRQNEKVYGAAVIAGWWSNLRNGLLRGTGQQLRCQNELSRLSRYNQCWVLRYWAKS